MPNRHTLISACVADDYSDTSNKAAKSLKHHAEDTLNITIQSTLTSLLTATAGEWTRQQREKTLSISQLTSIYQTIN